MNELNVFMSVGGTISDKQELFVAARWKTDCAPKGWFRTRWGGMPSAFDSPLKTVTELMDKCVGCLVIALERSYFPSGMEKRGGPKESPLSNVKLPTPWNQIEAAMAYSRGLPLMVVVEDGLRGEGLLERGYDWYVQSVTPEATVAAFE